MTMFFFNYQIQTISVLNVNNIFKFTEQTSPNEVSVSQTMYRYIALSK